MPKTGNEKGMRLRLLIVDDEKEMVEILTRLLEPISSKIDSADDLFPALELADKNAYNVIILDLRLKSSGKQEALSAIRHFKEKNSAVVVVSGLPDNHLKEDVLAAGADAFVPKDSDFGVRALLMATNVATLKLPHGSYKSDSYLQHVELLRKMVEHTA